MKENLFHEFPPNTLHEWLEKVEKDLKGKSFDELYWQADENIRLRPFYHPDEIEVPPVSLMSKTDNNWKIGTNITVFSTKKANRQLSHAISFGVNAPNFVITKVFSVKSLVKILENVNLDDIDLHFTMIRMEPEPVKFLKNLEQALTEIGHAPAKIHGSLTFHLKNPSYTELLAWKNEHLPGFRIFTLECKTVGVSMVEQLKAIIRSGIDLIEKNAHNKADIITINDNIQFSVTTGTKFLQEIAKIRAVRLLWANVMQSFGIDDFSMPPVFVNFDDIAFDENPYTNMIRATTMAMAAAIASADRINVLPANANFAKPDDFFRRIAINLQNILKMESHFDKVVDAGSGSYILEKLTDEFCENVWNEI